MDVNLTVNGTERQVAAGTTVAELVADVAGPARGVAVALNESVLTRGKWRDTALRPDDRVEILTATQGG